MTLQHFLKRVAGKIFAFLTERKNRFSFLELLLITLWILWAGRSFLNFDPDYWPEGRGFPSSVASAYFWRDFSECGACALWNGTELGGYPALIDPQGAPLHPLVALPTILWGAVNGGKIAILLSMAMIGLAQWWLARLLGVGRWARIWSSALAVVAGSLSGRMENGQVTLLLAIASTSLVIPAGVNLVIKRSYRAVVILALILAQAILAGQKFSLIAILLAILPMLWVYSLSHAQYSDLLRKLWMGIGLGVLLSAVFLVPALVDEERIDPQIFPENLGVQPLEYLPANLIIRDPEFFYTPQLKKLPEPGLYINYMGWVPLFLAVIALRVHWREKRPLLLFLVGLVFLCFLAAATLPQRWIENFLGITWFTSQPYPSLIATLVLLPVLGLATMGLDRLLVIGPKVILGLTPEKEWKTTLSSILLIVPLFWSILSAHQFSALWLKVNEVPKGARAVLNVMKTPSAAWIQLPSNEPYWLIYVHEAGLKIANSFRTWSLRERAIPMAQVQGLRPEEAGLEEPEFVVENLVITSNPQAAYALLFPNEGTPSVCQATAHGGNIDVLCNHSANGVLVVEEHSWPGWKAWIDNKPARLIEGEWLQLEMPSGRHQITFRYLPWDVPSGLALTLIGFGLAAHLWRKETAPEQTGRNESYPPLPVTDRSAQEHGRTQAEDGQDAT